MECQIKGFDCSEEDLCPCCKGTGQHPREEMCCSCDDCFDEEIGWNTGIRIGSPSHELARLEIRGLRKRFENRGRR